MKIQPVPPTTTHLAMSGVIDLAAGQEPATWGDHVTDAEYASAAERI
jgi:hypothetical protein